MQIHMRMNSPVHIECWAELYKNETKEFVVISNSISIIVGNELLIDDFRVLPEYRNQGIGRLMVEELKRRTNLPVRPIGVLPSAVKFWDKVTPGWRSLDGALDGMISEDGELLKIS
jgi:GNAT superfamily N-acetyltransferase